MADFIIYLNVKMGYYFSNNLLYGVFNIIWHLQGVLEKMISFQILTACVETPQIFMLNV